MANAKKYNRDWIIYNLLVAFAFYWLSNVILWYPWSYSTSLGMTIMLTLNPIIWGYAIYNILIRYKGKSKIIGALICASAMVFVAAIVDFIFFGIIRGALKELYHPTTFYGYGFVFFLPFLEMLIFKKRIRESSTILSRKDFTNMAVLGTLCVMIIAAIIVFDLNIVR
jgi:hypothetical protein